MIAKDFWWPKMGVFIQEYVKGCTTCQATKAATNRPKPPLFPITTNPDALPFEDVAIDLIVKLPTSQGYDSILRITDQGCSKAVIMIPCHKATDAEGMAQLYGQNVFPHYRIPRSVISDRDTCFASTFTKELCRCIGIRQNISTAYHPQTNGQSERTNQWLEQYLRIFVNHRQDNWARWLPIAQYVHNAWPSSTTKLPPFELIMGYTPCAHQIKNTQKLLTLQDCIEHVQHIRQEAQIAIQHAQELMTKAKSTLRHYHPFSEGQKVWLKGKNLSMTHPTTKLAPKRFAPLKFQGHCPPWYIS